MKFTYIAILLGVTLLAVQGQYAVSSVHDDCESNCPSSDSNCCGCCGSDSICSGNQISKRCCPSNSGFCGCISSRGYCSGSVYNQTGRVNGTDTFGTCYDTSAATCTYDPTPNLWIVCPTTYTPCKSNSFFSCCAPGTECTSTSISSYPTCAPIATTSSAETASTSAQDAQTQSSSSLAVPSENPSCEANCPSSNDTCCGCCTNGATCSGNLESKRCCPANSGFCGCISDRAYCSGSVYNQTGRVDGQDNFGTCFDASSGATCTYNPNPNLWIVCPKDYNACESASFFSCCGPDTVCTTSASDSYPICAPKNTQSAPATTSTPAAAAGESTCVKSDDCPSTLCSCNGACYSEDQYCCPNGQLTQKAFCPTTSTPTSSAAVASSTVAASSNVANPPATSSSCEKSDYCPSTLCACNGACYSEDQYCCSNGQLTQKAFCPTTSTPTSSSPAASSSARPAGVFINPTPEAYSTVYSGEQYTITYQSPTTPPGNVYILFLGPASLGQGSINGNPFTVTVTIPSSLASGLYNLTFIEEHNGMAFSDYNTETLRPLYVSNVVTSSTTANAAGSSSSSCEKSDYCPSTLCACNGACYSEDQYCCPNGQLTQKAFC